MPTTPAHVACFTGLYVTDGTIQPNADALANLVPGPGGQAVPVTATAYKLDPAAIVTDASTARTLTPNDDGKIISLTNANPNGARRPRRWQAALDRALARAGDGSIDDGLNKVADQVVRAALNGDAVAWKEIGDRMDGKAVQAIANAPSGDPFVIVMSETMAKL